MKNWGIVLIVFSFFCIGFVSAEQMICVDFDKPDNVFGLDYNLGSNSVEVSWSVPNDSPSCSGIDYYKVYNGDDFIVDTELNSVSFENVENSYLIKVYAVDYAGNVGDAGVLEINSVQVFDDSSGGGGSSGRSYVLNCSEWGECVNGKQIRLCSYGRSEYNESRNCFVQNLTSNIQNDFSPNVPEEKIEIQEDEKSGFSLITGRAIEGFSEMSTVPKVSISTFGILLALGIFLFFKKKGRMKGSFTVTG